MNHIIEKEAEKLYAQGYNLLVKSRIYWWEAEKSWVDEIDLKKRAFWRDYPLSVDVLKILAQGDALATAGDKLYAQADELLAD